MTNIARTSGVPSLSMVNYLKHCNQFVPVTYVDNNIVTHVELFRWNKESRKNDRGSIPLSRI